MALVVLSGALAGAEVAIVSLRKSRLDQLVQSGSVRARALRRLRSNPERLVATVQIGVAVLSITAGAYGGHACVRHVEPLVRGIPWLGDAADPVAFAIVAVIIVFLSLVVGGLVPKSLAVRYAEGYAMAVARPLRALSMIARPLVWLLTASSNALLRAFGDRTTFMEAHTSPEQIRELVDEAAQAGAVDWRAGEIASRAIDFADLTAHHVMLPRGRVVAVSRSATTEDVQRLVLEHGHTRMPVYEGTIDNVVGYVTVKDVLALCWEQKLLVLDDILRPAFYVVETMLAVDMLAEMKKRRVQLAIVVDERGAMIGIATMEDLIEELVGEIFGEHDPSVPEPIRREPDGARLIQGDVAVREVSRQLGIELPEGERWSTMAGLCLELAGRIPSAGERFTTPGGAEIEVVDASDRRIRVVRVRCPAATSPLPAPPG